MPRALPKPCAMPGCPNIVRQVRYCPSCKPKMNKSSRIDQKQRKKFYNSKLWKYTRLEQLEREPTCRHCREQGKETIANEVDHVKPIEQGGSPTDSRNLQSLCKSCHSKKTLSENNYGR